MEEFVTFAETLLPMATIEIKNMEFRAFHGCYKEEGIIGNNFSVDLTLCANTEAAELSDNLADTVNYQIAYNIVSREMGVTSQLIEHVASRIVTAVLEDLPTVDEVTVRVVKRNPPMGGRIESVSVALSKKRAVTNG